MLEKFKFWNATDPSAKKELSPDLGMRQWDDLDNDEKQKMWYHLKSFFKGKDGAVRVYLSIMLLNELHKYRSFGENFLIEATIPNALQDFQDIFLRQNQHAVFQLLSCFLKAILKERAKKSISRKDGESEEDYEKRNTNWRYEEFDKFKERLNDVFEQFGINVVLTRAGFVFRQDKMIIEEIYEPVLNFLSNQRWKEVNRELKDAFQDYQAKTASRYSSTVTHAISAIEAFLQLSLYEKTGKGTLGPLIAEAIDKGVIPNDVFSKQIFKNMELILARERKETGDAHPKKDYANEKNARLILNLTMVFLQHCIQSVK